MTAPIAENTCTVAFAPGASVASAQIELGPAHHVRDVGALKDRGTAGVLRRPITDTRPTRSLTLSELKDRTPDTCTPTTIAIQIPSTASGDNG